MFSGNRILLTRSSRYQNLHTHVFFFIGTSKFGCGKCYLLPKSYAEIVFKVLFRLLDFPLICNKFSTMNSHHYEIRLLKKLKKKVHVDIL